MGILWGEGQANGFAGQYETIKKANIDVVKNERNILESEVYKNICQRGYI